MSGSRSFCAIACWLSLAACSRSDASGPAGAAPARATAQSATAVAAIDAGSPQAAEATRDAGDALDPYRTSAPIGGKSVGHTSVVFKLKLEGGVDAAYKPRSTVVDGRYKGEIAAYRLARALSLDNVPPALPRSFAWDALQRAVGSEKTFAEVVKEPDGEVRGAIIPWIKGLEFARLDKPDEMKSWRAWLRDGGVIPGDQRAMAAQISTMLAFDMMTGNWDRWSGGNIGIDKAKNELLFVDNDGAFFDPVPVKEMRWPTALFEGVDRYSRSFVTALRALDVEHALGDERPGEPLLSRRVVQSCDERRRRVLAVIDGKIAKLGEARVLVFE